MKRYLVWGTSSISQFIGCNIKKKKSLALIGFLGKPDKSAETIANVYPEYVLKEVVDDIDAVFVPDTENVEVAYAYMRLIGYNRYIFKVPSSAVSGEIDIFDVSDKVKPFIQLIEDTKPVLPYFEYHLTDFCNLKCKSCGHFCDLVERLEYPDIDEFKKTMECLKSKFRGVNKIRLMGGEPLINKDLPDFVTIVAEIFPDADIRIVTNGLLFLKMDSALIDVVKEKTVTFDITQYPPTQKMIDDIMVFANEKELRLNLSSPVTKFMKRHYGMEGTGNAQEARKVCMSTYCRYLRGTRLYACTAVYMLYTYQHVLGITVSEDEMYHDSWDLLDATISGWDIIKATMFEFPFCEKCATSPEWELWESTVN